MSKRILIVGPFAEGTLPESYARAFDDIGWDVFRFDSDRAYFESTRLARHAAIRRFFKRSLWARANRTTIDVIRTVKPALVLVLKGSYLDPETIRRVRTEIGIPIVNYYPDNPFCGVPLDPRKTSAQRRDLMDALAEYTHVWIWEQSLADRMSAAGVAATYLPFGVDPYLRSDGGASASTGGCPACDGRHAVVFIGQHNAKRQTHIGAIQSTAVSIWGSRWARARREFAGRHHIHDTPCSTRQSSALYAAADISLNIVDDLNMPGHNMRTFEIAGSGGLLLSSYTAEQSRFFPEREAALYYRSAEELDEHLARGAGDPALRNKLRAAAARIASSHTYDTRAAAMLLELGLH